LDGDGESQTTIADKIKEINQKINKSVIKYMPAIYSGKDPIEHFLLVDGKRYRIEDPHDKIIGKIEDTKAKVCCNSPDIVKEKLAFFNAVWNKLVIG
jgi:hypothetical protein